VKIITKNKTEVNKMKAILTDILGTTSPAGFVNKLVEDSHTHGAQYIAKAIQLADASVLELLDDRLDGSGGQHIQLHSGHLLKWNKQQRSHCESKDQSPAPLQATL
jgi:methionine salvage enolase-phosphatase E1